MLDLFYLFVLVNHVEASVKQSVFPASLYWLDMFF